ncbi:MAG: CBS domain-containing protein [Bacillota bacterium]|nr:CBS domain-containing protein [Bacillota bacterium]
MKKTIFNYLLHKNEVSFLYDSICTEEGLKLMKTHHYTSVPVINTEGKYIGSVSEGDFLWNLLESDPDSFLKQPISSIVRDDYLEACSINTSTEKLFQLLLDQNYVPIVDDRNVFIGIVTRKTILSSLI